MPMTPTTTTIMPTATTTTTMTSKTAPPDLKQPSPFLRLPAELRIQIYTLLLVPPSLPTLRRLTSRSHYISTPLPTLSLPISLLRTNHQLHTECLPILYGLNTFSAHPALLTDLPFLLHRHRPVTQGAGKTLIRKWHLVVRLDTDPAFCASKVRDAFTGVEELTVDVFQAMYDSCDYGVLRLFEGVRGVGIARVRGSVGDGRFAGWLERRMMLGVGEEGEPFLENGEGDQKGRRAFEAVAGRREVLARTIRDGEVWAGNR